MRKCYIEIDMNYLIYIWYLASHFRKEFPLNCIYAPNTVLEFERYLVTDWYRLYHKRESLTAVEVRTWQQRCIPAGNYMFNVNNRNNRARCEICSKLTIKTPERRNWCRSGVFIVNVEHISHHVLVFLLLTLSRYSSRFTIHFIGTNYKIVNSNSREIASFLFT